MLIGRCCCHWTVDGRCCANSWTFVMSVGIDMRADVIALIICDWCCVTFDSALVIDVVITWLFGRCYANWLCNLQLLQGQIVSPWQMLLPLCLFVGWCYCLMFGWCYCHLFSFWLMLLPRWLMLLPLCSCWLVLLPWWLDVKSTHECWWLWLDGRWNSHGSIFKF